MVNLTLENFKKVEGNVFVFEYEKRLSSGDERIVKMPSPTPNARSVNDIAYIKSTGVKLFGTISKKVEEAIWIEIEDGHDINLCTKYIKAVATENGQYLCMRASMN